MSYTFELRQHTLIGKAAELLENVTALVNAKLPQTGDKNIDIAKKKIVADQLKRNIAQFNEYEQRSGLEKSRFATIVEARITKMRTERAAVVKERNRRMKERAQEMALMNSEAA